RARDLNAGADVTVKNARSYFSQAELDAFEKKVNDLNAEIARREDLARATAAKDRETKLLSDAEAAQARLRDDREQKIFESINRARDLQRERRYAEAAQIIDQVLYLDPNNPGGQLMRDLLVDLRQYDVYQNLKRKQGYGVQNAEMDTHEALVPPLKTMNFPENWPTKTFTRTEQLGASESPENRRAMASLDGRKVPVQFRGATLDKVLAYLGSSSQTDIVANWESLKSIGVEPGARVNLSLSQDIPAKLALEKVLEHVRSDAGSKLDYSIDGGIVTVASSDTIKRKTTSLPYNITDLLLETPDYKDVPELDLARVLASKADLDTRSGPFTKASQRDERNERMARIRQITDMVQRTIDPESWREAGGETGAITEINGTLVITQTPRNHAAIAGLLSKLREIRSIQINVESRFLLVSQDYFEQIGFDVDVYFNAQNNQVRAAQGLDPNIRPGDFFDFTQGSPLRRSLSSTTYAPNGSVNPVIIPPGTASQALQNTTNPNGWSPIGGNSNSLNLTQGLLPAAGFARDIVSSAPALGVAGQFLDDIQVDFLIKATQADRRTVTLTAPRLTLTNGQTSNVYVVTQRAIITDLEPVVGDSAVGFDPTTGTVAEGVVMLVEAVVSADRRFVTMNIDSSVNVIREIANSEITAIVGGALVNSAETGSFIQLPVITTTRVQTTATVPDEGTLLLGGQRLVTEIDIETGVPVLSKIPIINRFFTNRIQSKEESTLMILVKPTILIQTEEEERSFPGLMDTARTGLGN
ncbi:MAG: type II and III secretion system protein, partial [Phycisphaerales bacterium]|nr:type II and III secretion system protein [Phycisphaerales bacterium]